MGVGKKAFKKTQANKYIICQAVGRARDKNESGTQRELWRKSLLFLHRLVRVGLFGETTFEQRYLYQREEQGSSLSTWKKGTYNSESQMG